MSATPGPWKLLRAFDGFVGATDAEKDIGIVDSDLNIIAEVFYRIDDDVCADVEANARLIASAPEMLEALEATQKLLIALLLDNVSNSEIEDLHRGNKQALAQVGE